MKIACHFWRKQNYLFLICKYALNTASDKRKIIRVSKFISAQFSIFTDTCTKIMSKLIKKKKTRDSMDARPRRIWAHVRLDLVEYPKRESLNNDRGKVEVGDRQADFTINTKRYLINPKCTQNAGRYYRKLVWIHKLYIENHARWLDKKFILFLDNHPQRFECF